MDKTYKQEHTYHSKDNSNAVLFHFSWCLCQITPSWKFVFGTWSSINLSKRWDAARRMISIATKKGKYTFCQLPEILLISKSFISREQIMKKKLKWSFTDNVYFNADYNLPSYNTVWLCTICYYCTCSEKKTFFSVFFFSPKFRPLGILRQHQLMFVFTLKSFQFSFGQCQLGWKKKAFQWR